MTEKVDKLNVSIKLSISSLLSSLPAILLDYLDLVSTRSQISDCIVYYFAFLHILFSICCQILYLCLTKIKKEKSCDWFLVKQDQVNNTPIAC